METAPQSIETVKPVPVHVGTTALQNEIAPPDTSQASEQPVIPMGSEYKPIIPWDNNGMNLAHGDGRGRNWL